MGGKPDPKLYIWDIELDTIQFFNFESGRGEQDDYMPSTEGETETSDEERLVFVAASVIQGSLTSRVLARI